MEDTQGAWCWPQSVLGGEAVSLFISAEGAVKVHVVRQGAEEERVVTRTATATLQPVTEHTHSDGCDWSDTLVVETQPDWRSGFYRVDVTCSDGDVLHAYFIVRSRQPGRCLFVLSTSTWSAYNHWGGPSFYTGGHASSLRRPLPAGFLAKPDPRRWRLARLAEQDKAARRSFLESYSSWCMAAGWANQELLFARWAEQQRIQLDYATSVDLHQQGNELLTQDYSAYVSVGHDEYWSAEMRDAVEGFVSRGGSAAFFSGNTSFWQIRFEANDSRIIGYKLALEDDPVFNTPQEQSLSTMWSDPLVGRPENHMTGVSFTRGGYAHMQNAPRGTGGYTVWQPQHWALEGLDVRAGDVVGAQSVVVGYECDGCELELVDGVPVASGKDGTPQDFQVIGTAPAHLWETNEGLAIGLPDDYVGELNWVAQRLAGADTPSNRQRFALGRAVLGSFAKDKGTVFTTGCTDWAYGLEDPEVATITRNVLQRFGAMSR